MTKLLKYLIACKSTCVLFFLGKLRVDPPFTTHSLCLPELMCSPKNLVYKQVKLLS